MVNFKEDEQLKMLNHSCAHLMAQAIRHLYPHAKFWVGPVVAEGFYYDVDLGDDVIRDEDVAAIEKEMKKLAKKGDKIPRKRLSRCSAMTNIRLISSLTSKTEPLHVMSRAISRISAVDLMLTIRDSAVISSL